MKNTFLSAGAVALVAFAATPAMAQDVGAEPAYGSVNLTAGFTPDPHYVNMQAGGSINVTEDTNLPSACTGYIANAPDIDLYYTAGSLPLIISASAEFDATLIINTPSGEWICDDDGGSETNPSITLRKPQSGLYNIWVGTYTPGNEDARLSISETSSF